MTAVGFEKPAGAVLAARRALEAIERLNEQVNAMLTVTAESALARARAADEAEARDAWLGLLHGAVVSVKDCMDAEGVRTTFGSGAFADNVATQDATVVRRLRESGATLIGKNNLHEWCFGATTQNDHFGACRNPWDLSRVPGGSSGGSGAAVASGMSRISLGTDTGGSVRIPAALCGVSGLRPTVGAIPNTGVVQVSAAFDTVGPLAYGVPDVARAFAAIAGYDPADPLSTDHPAGNFLPSLGAGIEGIRIGVPRAFYFDDLQPDVGARVREAIRVLEACGARIIEIDLRGAPQAHEDAAFTIAVADAADVHRERMQHQAHVFGTETLRRLQLGTAVSGADYAAASRRLAEWKAQFREVFQRVDLIVTPTCPIVAPKIADAADMIETTRGLSRFTFAMGHAGLPALSVPCGFDADGMPVGMQLVAPWFSEALLFRAGVAFQSRTDFHRARPACWVE
ncbi:MAG: amidase [Candidatus Eremiobacteraeota bacterium]|nr:amidase [Candidatus Eremiobacteraeota bacterium]